MFRICSWAQAQTKTQMVSIGSYDLLSRKEDIWDILAITLFKSWDSGTESLTIKGIVWWIKWLFLSPLAGRKDLLFCCLARECHSWTWKIITCSDRLHIRDMYMWSLCLPLCCLCSIKEAMVLREIITYLHWALDKLFFHILGGCRLPDY